MTFPHHSSADYSKPFSSRNATSGLWWRPDWMSRQMEGQSLSTQVSANGGRATHIAKRRSMFLSCLGILAARPCLCTIGRESPHVVDDHEMPQFKSVHVYTAFRPLKAQQTAWGSTLTNQGLLKEISLSNSTLFPILFPTITLLLENRVFFPRCHFVSNPCFGGCSGGK